MTLFKIEQGVWYRASKAKPIPYDLVAVSNGAGTEKMGWWTGSYWDGLYLKDFPVKYWKMVRKKKH
jgi:hypothetical protein